MYHAHARRDVTRNRAFRGPAPPCLRVLNMHRGAHKSGTVSSLFAVCRPERVPHAPRIFPINYADNCKFSNNQAVSQFQIDSQLRGVHIYVQLWLSKAWNYNYQYIGL